ncbi:MAG: PAS domain-containing sensor histidine kinase [bacterium]|nr:PAS domain-containing sensor histidine kinase [bacterium]
MKRMHNKKRLVVSSKKLEEVFLSAATGLIVTDRRGVVTMLNPEALRLLGYPAREIIGKSAFERLAMEGREGKKAEKQPLKIALMTGKRFKQSHPNRLYYRKKSGDTFPVALTAAPIVRKKKIIGAVVLFADISELSKKDDEKDEFISFVAHQLNTPLAIIGLNTELMLRGTGGRLTKDQKKFLTDTLEASKRMAKLVRDLLNVSKIELGTIAADIGEVEPREASETVLAEFRDIINKKKLSIERKYDTNLPHLLVDKKLLNIIIENLVSNALKYTPSGGRVTVGLKRKGSYLLITVEDTGVGIPKRAEKKVFDKLYRADNAREMDGEGTGLGLYIVQSFLVRAKGKIWFTSRLGKGTTFYVEVPIHQ